MRPEKENLVNQLMHTRNSYIMGLAAMSLYQSGQAIPLLENHIAAFGDYTVTFNQIAALLKNESERGIVLNEFNKMLMRTTIKESFEHIKDYCESTDQYKLFKQQKWYEFARMIRNFLSHNCRFIFNRFDKERLPLKWKGIEITEEMNYKGLGLIPFGNTQTWELFQEFENFVHNHIK